MATKICNVCLEEKPEEDFPKHSQHKDGYRQPCKVCHRKKRKERRKPATQETHIRLKKNRFKRRYNLSLEEFELLKQSQDNKCAICGNDFINIESYKNKPQLDHNHETNEIRGILCLTCNSGIGFFNDSIELLIKAKEYLEKYYGS